MGEAFITRRGGAAVGTAAPSINFVSSTFDSITFTITNNDALTADIFWEIGDSTPDANTLSLAGGATSINQVASGLDAEETYTIFAFANAATKAGSQTTSTIITTPEAPLPAYFGDRGLFGGGDTTGTGTQTNVIDYITISTTGNATDFGDLISSQISVGGLSNGSRGVFGGGFVGGTFARTNIISYVTISTPANSVDFGDLTTARSGVATASNEIRGVFASSVIDYITIATTGNAINFGDLTVSRAEIAGCSDGSRGVFAGPNVIDYVTISTTGNAVDFGDLTGTSRSRIGASANRTRGVFGGGTTSTPTNIIDYVTIATTGNATDFGDLTQARYGLSGSANGTRAVFGGGRNPVYNIIDYITIDTTGNATDFGDLTVARELSGSLSGD